MRKHLFNAAVGLLMAIIAGWLLVGFWDLWYHPEWTNGQRFWRRGIYLLTALAFPVGILAGLGSDDIK